MNKGGRVQCLGGHNMFCYIILYFLFLLWQEKKSSVHIPSEIPPTPVPCCTPTAPQPTYKKILIHLVCRSHYSDVQLLDMGLDNCLSSIKCFRCLSSLCHWYFSHSCATERRQHRSKKKKKIMSHTYTHTRTRTHTLSTSDALCVYFKKKNPVCIKHSLFSYKSALCEVENRFF